MKKCSICSDNKTVGHGTQYMTEKSKGSLKTTTRAPRNRHRTWFMKTNNFLQFKSEINLTLSSTGTVPLLCYQRQGTTGCEIKQNSFLLSSITTSIQNALDLWYATITLNRFLFHSLPGDSLVLVLLSTTASIRIKFYCHTKHIRWYHEDRVITK